MFFHSQVPGAMLADDAAMAMAHVSSPRASQAAKDSERQRVKNAKSHGCAAVPVASQKGHVHLPLVLRLYSSWHHGSKLENVG